MEHDLIKTGDPDSCHAIEDGHGHVVLAYCRRCRRGEVELAKECPGAPPVKVGIHSVPLEIIKALIGEPCPKCKGKGSWIDTTYDRAGAETPCQPCRGTGRKLPTVEDLFRLVAQKDEQIIAQATSIQNGLSRIAVLEQQHRSAGMEIRALIAATGLTEDEGSLLGMVASICDLAEARCHDVRKTNEMRDQLKGVNELQLKEIDRLRAQIHEMCHDLHLSNPQVTAGEFCEGCEAFQVQKFGGSPIAAYREFVVEMEKIRSAHASEAAHNTGVFNRPQGPCQCAVCHAMNVLDSRFSELWNARLAKTPT